MDCVCPLTRLGRICRRGLLPNLPFTPNLVPKAPVLDVVRFVSSRVLAPKIGIMTAAPSALREQNVTSMVTYVSPVPLQYSIQCRASSRVPVPMFSTTYGSILATRHHAMNLQNTASVTSLALQRHTRRTRPFRIRYSLLRPRPTPGVASAPLADRPHPSSYRN